MASLDYEVTDDWGTGFLGRATVAAGTQALHGWTLEFDAAFAITNLWGAEIVSHVGDHYVVRNAAWNADVAAGGTASFGFQATPGAGDTAATDLTVEGPAVTSALPALTIANASIAEGNAERAVLAFTVSLSQAASGPVTVDYATGNGTATAGSDYRAKSGSLTFAAGETSKVIRVAVTADSAVEPNETLTVTLSGASGGSIARATATGTIVNDDLPSAGPSLDYVVGSNWGSGFTGDITVSGGAAALNGWTVAFDASFDITNIWNAELVSHVGDHYVVRNAAWNGLVGAGQEASFGFQANGGTTASGFTVNGTAAGDDPTAGVPSLSVANARVTEGNSGAHYLAFAVSLSGPSAQPVTVAFATADRTATAGSDYIARSGTLRFAAGETSKIVNVKVLGDTVPESSEALALVLSSPVGATFERAKATGTITNDDAASSLPTLGIADVSVVEGDPGAGGLGTGWLSTSGNQIVDAAGHHMQIAGVNWFGFESTTLAPHGLWARGYKDMMQQMVDLGFNTIRLPFSSEMLHTAAAPNGIDFTKNPDLQGLSALQVMDKIVDYAGQLGLRIILDHHRSGAGAGTSDNGLWYDGTYTQAQWIADWKMLAARYAGKPAVIGADLHNEPHNGTWGGGGATDWAAAAEQAGNAIGAANPNWLVFVEGVGTYQGQSYWWGGNLMGVKDRPIQLDVDHKLVYSAHDYPNSVFPQTWFQGSDFPANLPAKFDQMWGYIYKQGIAPVYVGEFGTKLVDPKDAPWLKAITAYMAGDLDNNGTRDIAAGDKGVGWTFWSWNPNSGDTGGILRDDWSGVNDAKLGYLQPIESPVDSAGGPANHADFVLTLSQPGTTAITVDFHTVAGTATAADFTSRSGSVTFAAGEQSKTISIPVTADDLGEANEHFTVVLTNAAGATITRATGTATIVDDDGSTATREFSPYIDMAMAQDADLVGISNASGIENFTLAFMLGSDQGIGWQGSGAITDDTLANGTTILHQVRAIQARGGHVTISFGGAAGQEAAATAPSAAVLQAQYQSVIDRYHVDSIDFDIEGAAVADQRSIALRDQALVGLQAANPDLEVSFTLPVLPTGLDANGLGVLRSAQRDGVEIDVVNIMAMDYGPGVDNGGQMGLNAINATVATEHQLADLGLGAKVGITPMIGVNDVASEVFTQADARALLAFALSDPNVVRLSMWSVARDNGGSAGASYASPDSSGVAQSPFEYAGIFNQFNGAG